MTARSICCAGRGPISGGGSLGGLVRGGLVLRSEAQRFHEGPVSFRFPMLFSGRAELHEWWSDDESFHVDLEVHNHRFGFLFGYRGTFTCEWVAASDAPDRLKPRSTEARL